MIDETNDGEVIPDGTIWGGKISAGVVSLSNHVCEMKNIIDELETRIYRTIAGVTVSLVVLMISLFIIILAV